MLAAYKSVGRGLAPAGKVDKERKSLVVSGIQNPLCAGMGCGCGAAARRKACPKPGALDGFESQQQNAPTEKPPSMMEAFFCVHREPDGSLCVFVRRRKAGGDFATRNPKTHFAEAPQATQKSTPHGVLFCVGAPSGIRTRDPLIKSQLLYQLS